MYICAFLNGVQYDVDAERSTLLSSFFSVHYFSAIHFVAQPKREWQIFIGKRASILASSGTDNVESVPRIVLEKKLFDFIMFPPNGFHSIAQHKLYGTRTADGVAPLRKYVYYKHGQKV